MRFKDALKDAERAAARERKALHSCFFINAGRKKKKETRPGGRSSSLDAAGPEAGELQISSAFSMASCAAS